MLVIDGIHNVSMANGLVRIQVARVGADGQSRGVEEIAIPSAQYGNIVQALSQAGQGLRQRLEEQQRKQTESQQPPSGQSSENPAGEADNFDFSNT